MNEFKWIGLALIFALVFPTVARAQVDLRNEDRAYFEKCEIARNVFLLLAERDIKAQKQLFSKTKTARWGASARRGAAGRYDFPTKEAKDEAVELYDATLQQMELLTDLVRDKERVVCPDRNIKFPQFFSAQVLPAGERSGTALLSVGNRGKSATIQWAIGIKLKKIPADEIVRVGSKERVKEKVLDAVVQDGKVTAVAEGIEPGQLKALWTAYLEEKRRSGIR